MDFGEASRLALRFQKLVEKLEKEEWEINATPVAIELWGLELLGMFPYEGAVIKTQVPQVLEATPWITGGSHNHVGGRSNCGSYAVLNFRYINPISEWYNSKTWPITIAHELAKRDQLEASGGADYLNHCVSQTPTSVFVAPFSRIDGDSVCRGIKQRAGSHPCPVV